MAAHVARAIRLADSDEEFDLGCVNSSDASDLLIQTAFKDPVDASKSHKLSLIVGAGKETRSKYNVSAVKWVRASLAALNDYAESTAGTPGTYSFRHDTNKNLKFFVVHPLIKPTKDDDENEYEDGDDDGSPRCVDEYLTFSSLETFGDMISSHKLFCYRLKRRALEVLVQAKNDFDAYEGRLLKGQLLSSEEERTYSNTVGLEDKISALQANIKEFVDAKRFTAQDKVLILTNLREKLAAASQASKTKLAAKLTKRIEMVESVESTLKYYAFAHEKQMKNAKQKATEFARQTKVGDRARAAYALEQQTACEEDLMEFAESQRGWFETHEELVERLEAFSTAFRFVEPRANKSGKGKGKGSSSSAWTSTGAKSGPRGFQRNAKPLTSSKPKKPANAFSAFGDSSSDDE